MTERLHTLTYKVLVSILSLSFDDIFCSPIIFTLIKQMETGCEVQYSRVPPLESD